MEYQNRKKRREFAKLLGLIKQKQKLNKTSTEYFEMLYKATEAGNKIHTQFEQDTYNSIKKQEAEKDNQMLINFTEPFKYKDKIFNEGIPKEKAEEIINRNNFLKIQRKRKLAQRKIKQK